MRYSNQSDINRINEVYGFIKVIKLARINRNNNSIWLCECTCGANLEIPDRVFRERGYLSCGCRADYLRNSHRNLGPMESILRGKYREYRGGAAVRNLEFLLTREEFDKLIVGDCCYCGSKTSSIDVDRYALGKWRDKYKSVRSNFSGIDRKDSLIGYISNNCISCCSRCNLAKGSMSYIEFKDWIHRVHKRFAYDLGANLPGGLRGFI